jgi:outer membrane protein assembly factor BamB
MKHLTITLALVLSLSTVSSVFSDWPTWGGDSGHTFVSEDPFPVNMTLAWKRELSRPSPAWPLTQQKLRFDDAHGVIIAGDLVLVNSSVTDDLTAYSLVDGEEKWSFTANGPVRFSPSVKDTKVFLGADDGYLYCLDLNSGEELWRFRGGPDDRKLLGNGRMVSMWCVRGAPVVDGDHVYFAAGIWPFMGVFIHCLNITTGEVVWTNSSTGSTYTMQQHSSPAFGGVAPQGYLTISGDVLLVPGGRSVPAAFSKHTGRLLFFNMASRAMGKAAGGFDVRAGDGMFVNGTACYSLPGGEPLAMHNVSIIEESALYGAAHNSLSAISPNFEREEITDRRGKKMIRHTPVVLWEKGVALQTLLLKAGDTFLGVDGDNMLVAYSQKDEEPLWRYPLPSKPGHIAFSSGILAVSTQDGSILCFSSKGAGPVEHKLAERVVPEGDSALAVFALTQIKRKDHAFALLVQPDSKEAISELVRQTDMDIIVLESDLTQSTAFRSEFPPERVHVIVGTPEDTAMPAYFADLVICGNRVESFLSSTTQAKQLINTIRPFGGVLIAPASLASQLKRGMSENEAIKQDSSYIVLSREGALKGAGTWTHQGADSGNSLVSQDSLVKLPLGMLWFGGPSHSGVLPRHGHGPTPQSIGGRVFMEGANMIRAVDSYNGKLLWEKNIPNLGSYYNNTAHHPGANEIGSNFASSPEAVYAFTPDKCLKLSAETGEVESIFRLPGKANWGTIKLYKRYLIAGGAPLAVSANIEKEASGVSESGKRASWAHMRGVMHNASHASGSRRLFVLDKHTGAVLWERDAAFRFRHNTIVAAEDKIFLIDSLSSKQRGVLKQSGADVPSEARLLALDIEDGSVVWKKEDNVFGTWLSYSADHKVLFQGGSANRDRAWDEAGAGMVVYKAETGDELWSNVDRYGGPVILHGDKAITQECAYELLTGEKLKVSHPISGKEVEWTFTRNYGCNTAIASKNLLTFRSAAAGYYNLANNSGTGNFGGFKSGCTASLIPAGGVINAPDYTRTCTCSYQIQSSLALVPMPDVDTWTFNSIADADSIERLGINFGAPGDRMAESGSLWLEWPVVGGPSPAIPVVVEPEYETFHSHSSIIDSDHPLRWVAASGLTGMTQISIDLLSEGTHTMNLVVPGHKQVGPFTVRVNGEAIMEDFIPTSGQPEVRTFRGVSHDGQLVLTFSGDNPAISGLELIREPANR